MLYPNASVILLRTHLGMFLSVYFQVPPQEVLRASPQEFLTF
ncbi:MAG: hypothetical protein G01um101438_490 [Parcubacteria group bacterium Gr01-1014_38]|nr:MAG: hypothetical protein G01um101438_490 [Parcubacteria group bacterium Gr01-1014_38]